MVVLVLVLVVVLLLLPRERAWAPERPPGTRASSPQWCCFERPKRGGSSQSRGARMLSWFVWLARLATSTSVFLENTRSRCCFCWGTKEKEATTIRQRTGAERGVERASERAAAPPSYHRPTLIQLHPHLLSFSHHHHHRRSSTIKLSLALVARYHRESSKLKCERWGGGAFRKGRRRKGGEEREEGSPPPSPLLAPPPLAKKRATWRPSLPPTPPWAARTTTTTIWRCV